MNSDLKQSTPFDFSKDPFENFQALYSIAEKIVVKDSNAMALATVDELGQPSLRTVLFKGLVRNGFSFYTNYSSQKAQQLARNQKASLLFFWATLEQQVRLEGLVQKMTDAESDQYFATRPRISQLGAWASSQSQKISGPEELANNLKKIEHKFSGQTVSRPPHWGGFILVPNMMEFWFGQKGRLHDRFVYERASDALNWVRSMKSP
jgi:pyridoxamine 5'-phosphate oxidase